MALSLKRGFLPSAAPPRDEKPPGVTRCSMRLTKARMGKGMYLPICCHGEAAIAAEAIPSRAWRWLRRLQRLAMTPGLRFLPLRAGSYKGMDVHRLIGAEE